MHLRILAIAAALVCAGCATVGTKINFAAVQGYQVGVTTKDDAIRDLGRPSSETVSDDTTILSWTYAEASAFSGPRAESVQLWFGRDGKLTRRTTSTHNPQ